MKCGIATHHLCSLRMQDSLDGPFSAFFLQLGEDQRSLAPWEPPSLGPWAELNRPKASIRWSKSERKSQAFAPL